MNLVTLIVLSTVSTIAGAPLMKSLVRRFHLVRPNFKGQEIPGGFGYLLVLSSTPGYILASVLWQRSMSETLSFLAGVMVFATLGLLDDIYGSRLTGGFRGHFAQLARGRVTTGAVKALGGGVAAVLLGAFAANFQPALTILNSLIIALAANLLNLLDLRPGRAVFCYWILFLAFALSRIGGPWSWWTVVPILPAAIWLTGLDRRAKIMLGDAGSNALGAVLGLLAAWNLGTVTKLVALAVLIGIHLYSEKYSISRLIDNHPALRRIDYKLGER